MLLKKITGNNYFVALVILLLVIFVLVLAAFLLVNYFPGALGTSPVTYEIKDIYQFEPWSLSLSDLEAAFPEGGIILPVYVQEKQKGALFLGNGQFYSLLRPLEIKNPAGFFVAISDEKLEEKRGDIIFVPVEDYRTQRHVLNIWEKQLTLPVVWADGIPLTFYPHQDAIYYYLIDEEGSPVLPPHLEDNPLTPFMAALLYALLFTIILVVLLIFSLDHQPSRYWKFIFSSPPGAPLLLTAAVAAFLAFAGELTPGMTGLPQYSMAIGYVAALGLIFLLSWFKKIDFADAGLRLETARRGYLTVAAATIMFIVMTMGIPKGISWAGWDSLKELALLFITVGLLRELLWRGFMQTVLSRQWGATTGLLLTVLLTAGVNLVKICVFSPWMLFYPYTYVEAAVLVPGLSMVLGFLYLRTENVLSCALLHTLLLYLPRVLVV